VWPQSQIHASIQEFCFSFGRRKDRKTDSHTHTHTHTHTYTHTHTTNPCVCFDQVTEHPIIQPRTCLYLAELQRV
jgi:carbohydrate-binding DOMON domain-containing protein